MTSCRPQPPDFEARVFIAVAKVYMKSVYRVVASTMLVRVGTEQSALEGQWRMQPASNL
jgi:hypothetical protein